MKKETIVKKNLDLLDEFMKYAFDHPDILDDIPKDRLGATKQKNPAPVES